METFEITVDQTSKQYKDNLKKYYKYYARHDKIAVLMRLIIIVAGIVGLSFGTYFLLNYSWNLELIIEMLIVLLGLIFQHYLYLAYYKRSFPKAPLKNQKIVFTIESIQFAGNKTAFTYNNSDFTKFEETPYAFVLHTPKSLRNKNILILKYIFTKEQIASLKKLWNLKI